MASIQITKSDITKLSVDVIVNAANAALCGGGGVDGAIHRAAGPKLVEECKGLGGANTGQVKQTLAYKLPSKYVFHAVGPVWYGGHKNEEAHLKSCYLSSLEMCREQNLTSIAFPSISCGAYRFPYQLACEISYSTVHDFLNESSSIKEVVFCCFEDKIFSEYTKLQNRN